MVWQWNRRDSPHSPANSFGLGAVGAAGEHQGVEDNFAISFAQCDRNLAESKRGEDGGVVKTAIASRNFLFIEWNSAFLLLSFKVTYVGAVLSGDLIFWQYCYERYTQLRRDKDNLDERIELLKALGVTKDAWLQNRLLTYVMTLPSAEITPTLEAIASTPTGESSKLPQSRLSNFARSSTGGAMACRFLQAKWFDLQKRFGRGSINFAKVISAITKYGANKFDYDEVSDGNCLRRAGQSKLNQFRSLQLKSLVDRFGDGPGMQLLTMTLRTVAANVEWISRSHSTIYNWVEGNYS